MLAGTVAGLTAICYAELASAVPVSGSSYSYAYATLGEGVAMVVAACLLLEYGVSAAAVAVGWSQYLNELLDNLFGFTIPENLSQAPEAGGIFNLPAVVLVGLCTLLLIRGASESAKVNAAMVMIKIGVLVLFVVLGVQGWSSDNLSDFTPFGLGGITSAAGIIFFSYIGLDAVSTAGEEVRNPRRTMPLAIIISLVTVTALYCVVAIVAVAAQPVAAFDGQEAGLAAILEDVTGSTWPATVLAAGAVVSIFSVTLVVIYGQTRILFAMGRDGMIPPIFHRVNPRTLTPVPATIIVAVVVSLLAGVLPINFLAEMTSIGTLVAFLVVSVGVMVLRRTAPDLPRGFKVPGYPVTPLLSIVGLLLDHQGPARGHDLRVRDLGRRSRSPGTSSTASSTPSWGRRNDLRRRLRARRARAGGARARGDAGARERRGPARRLGRAAPVAARAGRASTPSTRPRWGRPRGRRLDEARSRLSVDARVRRAPRALDGRRPGRGRRAARRGADRARLLRDGRARAGLARLGQLAAAVQLADPGRARPARVPLPRRVPGASRDGGVRRLRRHAGRRPPRASPSAWEPRCGC